VVDHAEGRALPNFRYHLDPVKSGVIVEEQTTCPVCGYVRSYAYVGPFYSVEEVTGVCPWCIADGSAAAKYDGEFIDAASCEEAAPAHFDELIHRTPSYIGWQQEVWLSHCNDHCAFAGYVGWTEIQPIYHELLNDLDMIKTRFRLEDSQLEYLRDGGSLQGYLFQCVICGTYRLAADAD